MESVPYSDTARGLLPIEDPSRSSATWGLFPRRTASILAAVRLIEAVKVKNALDATMAGRGDGA